MNSVSLVGRLTKDVEVQKTTNNINFAKFTVAINDEFNKEQVDFINCVAWKHQADFLGNYANKGSLVSVVGKITTGNYKNKDGNTIYTTDVNVRSVKILSNNNSQETKREEKNHSDLPQKQETNEDSPF